MISSRCKENFPAVATGRSLSEIRKELKTEIEATKIFDKPAFEVWINEVTPPQRGTWDSWDTCIEAVKDCDVLISLYNGHAGWGSTSSDIGICHAELMTGLEQAPGKIRLINLGNIAEAKTNEEKQRNERFDKYVNTQNLFRGGEVHSIDDLKQRVKEAIYDALINLTQSGVREASKGKFHSGESLQWSRLNYKERQEKMCRVLIDAITKRPNSKEDGNVLFASLGGKEVLFIPNAIPDSISVSQAKEMVGQPFLRDHEYHDVISDNQGGPVHIIACHKGATEIQAKKLLGFPDATVVNAPFGVFVADNIQKVQFVFIVNCRDETTTRYGVQRFFEWLEQNGEDMLLAARALARTRIIKAIAKESSS
jgi:hypothetical protein